MAKRKVMAVSKATAQLRAMKLELVEQMANDFGPSVAAQVNRQVTLPALAQITVQVDREIAELVAQLRK